MKIFGLGESLRDEALTDSRSVHRDQASVRLFRKNQFGDAGHHGGIEQPGEDRENQCESKSRSKLLDHLLLLLFRRALSSARILRQMYRDDELVDQPNSGKRHDDSAETVDQKIAAQHLAGADGLV